MQEDEKTIEELCKPLSAKVMPRSAMILWTGEYVGEEQALWVQRRRFDYNKKKKSKDRKQ